MSNFLKRRDVVITIIAVTFLIEFIPYFINFPQLEYTARKLSTVSSVITCFALLLAVYAVFRRFAEITRARLRGWPFQVALVVIMILVAVFGLALGTDSNQYTWIMLAIVAPLGAINYGILAFYMASAGARAFRARSIQSTLMLITGLIILFQQAPYTGVVFPIFDSFAKFNADAILMSTNRVFIIAVAVGSIVLGVRVLLGKESQSLGLE